MAGEDGVDALVEKTMSISRPEFETGLQRLAGTAPISRDQEGYLLQGVGAERQTIRCSFEPLPDAVLGKFLKLPRARITLHLASLSSEARADFLALFDRTFQRGGG